LKILVFLKTVEKVDGVDKKISQGKNRPGEAENIHIF
jgi:hypothetical protein